MMPVEVVQLTPAQRVLKTGLFLLIAGLLYAFSASLRPEIRWVQWIPAAIALWAALYYLRAPAVLARADDAGFSYVDARRGWLFVFTEGRAAWSDVLVASTRRRYRRYGSWLETRVTVRDEGGVETRTLAISDTCKGYPEFLDALRTHASPTVAAQLAVPPPGVTNMQRALIALA